MFLSRRLYRRRHGGEVIRPDFVRLHYPRCYHYDVLGGLTGLGELARVGDPRAAAALDLLQSRWLPTGGWPADTRYYRSGSRTLGGRRDFVAWGGAGSRQSNPWVTAEALGVLARAGRIAL